MQPVADPGIRSLKWYETWRIALFHPSIKALSQISSDPKASTQRGILWMMVNALVAWVLGPSRILLGGLAANTFYFESLTWFNIIGALIVPFLGAGGLLLGAALTHSFARLFKGAGTFHQLVYTNAVIQLPYLLLSGLPIFLNSIILRFVSYRSSLGLIFSMIADLLFLIVTLYLAYTQIIAFCAVEKFGFSKGFGVLFLTALVISILGTCLSWGLQALSQNYLPY